MDGVCEWDDTKDDGDEIPGACVPVNKTCPDHGGGHDMPGHGGEDPAITVICSSYDEMHCQGCTSDGPCHWGGPSLGCTAKTDEKCETPNDGHGGGEHGNSGDPDSGHGVGHGDHGSGHGEHGHGGGGSDPGFVCDPVSEPCQKDSTFPLYCEAASADAASPVEDHHMMAGLFIGRAGSSFENRGDAAAATRRFRGDESRRRRGRDADSPRRQSRTPQVHA